MRAAITAVNNRIQDQKARLAAAMRDPKKEHSISSIRHDIEELEEGLAVLLQVHNDRTIMSNLQRRLEDK